MGGKMMRTAGVAQAQGSLLGMQSFKISLAHSRGRGDGAAPSRWGLCLCCRLQAGPLDRNAVMMGWHVLQATPLPWLASLSSIKTCSAFDSRAGRARFEQASCRSGGTNKVKKYRRSDPPACAPDHVSLVPTLGTGLRLGAVHACTPALPAPYVRQLVSPALPCPCLVAPG